MFSCHPFRLLHVVFWQSIGWTTSYQRKTPQQEVAHLGIFELLLDIPDRVLAPLTHERPADEFRPDFGRPRDRPTDAHELADPVHPQISDPRGEREIVEGDPEFAGCER